MSKINAIEKLREWANQHKGWSLYDIQINEIADEIEHEISERFIKMPVDADGVPIHVGDEITDKDSIPCIITSVSATRVYCKDGSWVYPSDCHHSAWKELMGKMGE